MPLIRRVAALGAAVAAVRRYARQNPEKVNRYADQAAAFVNSRTAGKYSKQVDSALRQVRKETSVPGRPTQFGGQAGGPLGNGTRTGPQHQPAQQYPSYREDRPGNQR